MVAWWDSLSVLMKTLYCIAIPASLVFVIQLLLSIFGGLDGGADVDFDGQADFSATVDGNMDLHPNVDIHDASHVGGDTHSAMDIGDHADFKIGRMYTVQGIVAFLVVMSWSAIVFLNTTGSAFLALGLGVLFGLIAMYAVARLIYTSRRLAEEGTLNLKNAIGTLGKVYIPVLPNSAAVGKVMINIQGRYTECNAATEGDEALQTGTLIRVVDVRGDLLIVEKEGG